MELSLQKGCIKMCQNRSIPYGYMIAAGKLVINNQESKTLVEIFKRYGSGESYKTISDWLTRMNIPYSENKKVWNKNMIARILQNQIYNGDSEFPQIISKELYQNADKNKKQFKQSESSDIKKLKPLMICSKCGAPLKRRIKTSGGERWYCVNSPEHINTAVNDQILLDGIFTLQKKIKDINLNLEEKTSIENDKTIALNNKIYMSIKTTNLDNDNIRKDIMKLAIARYNNIDNQSKYDGNLERIIKELNDNILEADRITEITKSIVVSEHGETSLILKNNQKINFM